VEKLIKDFNERKDQELNRKRRVCALPKIMANDPEVLGKVSKSHYFFKLLRFLKHLLAISLSIKWESQLLLHSFVHHKWLSLLC
jgi:hypothetical protein